VFVAVVCALVTLALGIYPEPLFDIAKDAGSTLFALR
jgi:NADH-quinone oxidoreductase subunit N